MSDTNNVDAVMSNGPEETAAAEQLAKQVEADKAISELQTLEKLAAVPSENAAVAKLNESPIRDVEKSLGDFTKHTFEIINKEYQFQETIEAEIAARLQLDAKDGGFTAKELIALHTNNSVNLNDRVSKVLGPTFTLMTEEVKAEIAARTAEKQQQQAQVNIAIGGNTSPEQMKGLNETVGGGNRDEAQAILQGAFMFQQFLQQLGVKTPMETIAGAQQENQN